MILNGVHDIYASIILEDVKALNCTTNYFQTEGTFITSVASAYISLRNCNTNITQCKGNKL